MLFAFVCLNQVLFCVITIFLTFYLVVAITKNFLNSIFVDGYSLIRSRDLVCYKNFTVDKRCVTCILLAITDSNSNFVSWSQ